MKRAELQTQLENLYENWRADLKTWEARLLLSEKQEAAGLGPPILLNVTDAYCRAERRVLVFGMESNGWQWNKQELSDKKSAGRWSYPPWPFQEDIKWCSDFLAKPDSIKALCWAYREFLFGTPPCDIRCVPANQPEIRGRPFWRAFREIGGWPGVGLMWGNVVRMDFNWGNHAGRGCSIRNASKTLREPLISQHETLAAAELAILKPHICIFFSGHNYDEFLKTMLPGGCDIKAACCELPEMRLARVIHPALPCASFRTDHPITLNVNRRWHYIEKMRSLAYGNNFGPSAAAN